MKIIKIAMPMIRKDQLPEGYEVKMTFKNLEKVIFKIISEDEYDSLGFIKIRPCEDNIWYVAYVVSNKGYGPLLYDTALQYVTDLGGDLISEEEAGKRFPQLFPENDSSTSPAAKKIWDFYRENRGDVEESDRGFRFKKQIN